MSVLVGIVSLGYAPKVLRFAARMAKLQQA